MAGARDETDGFLAELDAELDQPGRSMARHPVVADILAGRLSREQLKSWVAQQYLFSRTVPKLLALRYAQVTDPAVLAHLRHVMDEELAGKQTGTDHHVRLHLRAALGLGMTEAELEQTRPYPETRALVYWQELVIRSRAWFLALGMKYGDEGQFGPVAARLAVGLRERYGLSAEDVVFYSAHEEADAEHGGFYREIVRTYVTAPALRAELRELALTAAELWWDMWYAGAYGRPDTRTAPPGRS
jgi:pyrroloquinoline-quinone synthase